MKFSLFSKLNILNWKSKIELEKKEKCVGNNKPIESLLKNHYSSLYMDINLKLINYQLFNLISE